MFEQLQLQVDVIIKLNKPGGCPKYEYFSMAVLLFCFVFLKEKSFRYVFT